MLRCSVLAAATGVLCAAFAHATVWTFTFPIDGLQEVPAVATPAFGEAHVMYDDVTNALSWTVTYQDLIGTMTAAHFHRGAVGANGPVIVNIGAGASPRVGSATLTDAQELEILGGMWYVNIHSSFKPGGEIRGQVVNGVSTCKGDMNCDGEMNFADIDRFVEALGYPGGVGWPHLDCVWRQGDMDGNSAVNFADIDGFVAALSAPCP